MRQFCAESKSGELVFAITFEARNYIHAKRICEERNWSLLGEFIDETPEIEAMVYRRIVRPTLH